MAYTLDCSWIDEFAEEFSCICSICGQRASTDCGDVWCCRVVTDKCCQCMEKEEELRRKEEEERRRQEDEERRHEEEEEERSFDEKVQQFKEWYYRYEEEKKQLANDKCNKSGCVACDPNVQDKWCMQCDSPLACGKYHVCHAVDGIHIICDGEHCWTDNTCVLCSLGP